MEYNLEQIGGRVVVSKVFYKDTPNNRKLKRVGQLWKYKYSYAKPGGKARVWYKLVKPKNNRKKCPSPKQERNKFGKCVTKKCSPNKKLSPKGNCVLKKCPSGKKLTLKGKCINKSKQTKKLTIYQAKELFDAEARAARAEKDKKRRSGKKSRSPRKSQKGNQRRSSRNNRRSSRNNRRR